MAAEQPGSGDDRQASGCGSEATPPAGRRRTGRTLANAAGLLLTSAALFYLFRTSLASLRETGLHEILSFDPALFILSFLFLQLHLFAAAWSWQRATAVAGSRITIRQAYAIHFVALVGKYVPGKVWAAVGKIGLSREAGVPASRAGQALVLETLLIVAGSLMMGIPLVPGLSSRLNISLVLGFAAVAAVVVLLVVASHPSAYRKLLDVAGRITGRSFACSDPGFGSILRLLPVYLAVFSLMGIAFLLLAKSFGVDLPLFPGISVFPTAAAIGFLVLLAPGGLGVSEISLTWLMAMIMAEGDPGRYAIVALASRLWLTLGELTAFGIAVSLWGGRKALRSLLGREAAPPSGTA
jgi:hypothetical protein